MLQGVMSKTKISAASAMGALIHAHLMPIIEFALAKGCRFDTTWLERPFAATKNGAVCDLYGELSMEDIAAHFELPKTIKIGGPHKRCIWDSESNIKLCIHPE